MYKDVENTILVQMVNWIYCEVLPIKLANGDYTNKSIGFNWFLNNFLFHVPNIVDQWLVNFTSLKCPMSMLLKGMQPF